MSEQTPIPAYDAHRPYEDSRGRWCVSDDMAWPCEVASAHAAGLAAGRTPPTNSDDLYLSIAVGIDPLDPEECAASPTFRAAVDAAVAAGRTAAAEDIRAEIVQRWRAREWGNDPELAERLHHLLGDVDECEHDLNGDPSACYRKIVDTFLNELVERGWTPPDEPYSAADVDAAPGLDLAGLIANLVEARQRAGLSQRDVARQMGTVQSAVCELETLQVEPQISTLMRYAAACGSRVTFAAARVAENGADRWLCGAFESQPSPGLNPYRCTEPHGHGGNHRAVIDAGAVAEWREFGADQ